MPFSDGLEHFLGAIRLVSAELAALETSALLLLGVVLLGVLVLNAAYCYGVYRIVASQAPWIVQGLGLGFVFGVSTITTIVMLRSVI